MERMMQRRTAFLGAACSIGGLLAVACTPTAPQQFSARGEAPYFNGWTSAAAGDACLQNNRIWGWRVLDERTLVVNDIENQPFLVRLSG
jgi:hypothetical protein